jgi:osmoprotectant transport system substrate-binding protein
MAMTSHHRKISTALLAGLATVLTMTMAACGKEGSSGTEQPQGATGQGCAPVAGEQLVVLQDDKKLQNSDNIVAAVSSKAPNSAAVIAATDKVAAALDTPKLIALNKAVDVDRKTPQQAAQEFATQAGLTTGLSGGSGAIKVGAADFSESATLGELYKLALNAAGFTATVQTVGNRELYEPALERGEIHVFPEYAATLTEFLNQKANGKDAQAKASGEITETMTALKALGQPVGLTFGTPSPAADQNAFAVTKAFADKYGVKTLTEFGQKCSGTASVLAGPAECPQRPFCQPGLKDTYNITFGQFHQADAGGPQTKTELKTGQASLGLVFSSDGSLATS